MGANEADSKPLVIGLKINKKLCELCITYGNRKSGLFWDKIPSMYNVQFFTISGGLTENYDTAGIVLSQKFKFFCLLVGAGVVTTRAHVHYVVTEFGIAYLFGKNLRQRAHALIEIAHPDHREALTKAAFDRLKVMPSPQTDTALKHHCAAMLTHTPVATQLVTAKQEMLIALFELVF